MPNGYTHSDHHASIRDHADHIEERLLKKIKALEARIEELEETAVRIPETYTNKHRMLCRLLAAARSVVHWERPDDLLDLRHLIDEIDKKLKEEEM